MRTKSEAKRQKILDVAAQVFREEGFERASMAEICARVGGSKATLYSHFPSKEALFFEVMFLSTEAEFEATHAALNPDTGDLGDALRHFGRRFITLLTSPEVMAVRRLIVSESGRSALGSTCYERGPKRSEGIMVAFLEKAVEAGKLRPGNLRVMTLHLRGLREAELMDGFLFGIWETPPEGLVDGAVERAVEVFLRAYGQP